jgi:DNA-binding NarL/FixJ family response regulator
MGGSLEARNDPLALSGIPRSLRRVGADTSHVVRVLVIDDHAIYRAAMDALLRSTPGVQVVGQSAGGEDALAAAQRLAPDLILLSVGALGGGSDVTIVRELARLPFAPKILVVATRAAEDRLVALLKDGACGFVSGDCTDHDLTEAIRAVAGGDFYVRPEVARLLAANAMPRRAQSPVEALRETFESLSARERSVFLRTAEGHSGVEIAHLLNITPKTIDTYKARIGKKLGFTHRTDYVRLALRLGLLGHDAGQRTADEVARDHRQP